MYDNKTYIGLGADWDGSSSWEGGNGAVSSPPGTSDSAFVNGGSTASIGAAEPTTTNVFVGQGPGNGRVNMTGGSLTSTGLYLGRDIPANTPDGTNYGMWYQTAGTLTASSVIVLGNVVGTSGELVDEGGSVTTVTAFVGSLGYGALTVAGGSFTASTLKIASGTGSVTQYPGETREGSYVNVNSGSMTVNGNVSVGVPDSGFGTQDGILKLSGGTNKWSGDLDVEGKNSELAVSGNSTTLGSWSGTTSGATALTIGSGAELEFDLLPSSVSSGSPLLNLGAGTLSAATGSSIEVDGTELNYAGAGAQTYNLLKYAGAAVPFPSSSLIGFDGRTAKIVTTSSGGYTTVSLQVGAFTATATTPVSNGQVTSTIVDAGHSTTYNYSPSFMYDESEGLFKIWSTYHINGGSTPNDTTPEGDNISYKESPTIAGLNYAPLRDSLMPNPNRANTFDAWDVADPCVYKGATGSTYYMAFSAYPYATAPANQAPTLIGMATSIDGGRTFTTQYTNTSEQFNGNTATGQLDLSSAFYHSTNTGGVRLYRGGYGYGQPSVTYDTSNKLYYMSFTDSPDPVGNPDGATNPQRVDLVSSSTPSFSSITPIDFILQSQYMGAGPDMLYDQTTNNLVLATDTSTNGQGSFPVSLVEFTPSTSENTGGSNSSNFSYLQMIGGQDFEFGEQVGMLKNAEGYLVGSGFYSFVGATSQGSGADADIQGPTSYITEVAAPRFANP